MSDNELLLWILLPLFTLVGLYLIWYARRRRRLMARFARERELPIRRDYRKPLQRCLDNAFALPQADATRSFGQLAAIVDAEKAWLFLAVELLDLSRYGQAQSSHSPRLAALFKVRPELDAFFLVDTVGRVEDRLPEIPPAKPGVVTAVHEAMKGSGAGHTLSVTLSKGYGLIYFEPRITGAEDRADLESLYGIAIELHKRLF
ncbi:hypothetical protein GCM10011352_35020 [Marinobacterium zhoushanense]|uniref:DUF2726 domain-containing protein n=1 Tax=Marinobacterium zhoushanense TaxID=1679163 RepID=A0ABQ1KNE9_9GAMM|nr:hypothetical protein [Marinobacterium zhoushanense]GGC05821.1 hypothetical protein GCM10011352_35020 [Marinobacterium zhoushanense]